MYRDISSLILYSSMPGDEILASIGRIYRDWSLGSVSKAELTHRIYEQVKRILDLSTAYGFDRNLWQNYLTFLMISHENSFSLTCERASASHGSIESIALHDFEIFRRLMHFDFAPLEEDLGISCFSLLCNYHAIAKREQLFNRLVSEKVCALSKKLDKAVDAKKIYALVTRHFEDFGVGLFGLNRAFRVLESAPHLQFQEINNLDQVMLDDLIGYDQQKTALRMNIEAFLAGKPFNNTLLYGDAGTGKSTSVKALANEYYQQGLRIVEINKYQFHLLSQVISMVKTRNYKFILFMDDLSFEENEGEYKFLKAVIEGGLENRPDNVMLLATSNRRHLIRENWNDRSDMEHEMDMHRSDTMQEKLSLAARFGCSIAYYAPNHKQYQDIVRGIAARSSLALSDAELMALANQYELSHGGTSGRTAQQFINMLLGSQLS